MYNESLKEKKEPGEKEEIIYTETNINSKIVEKLELSKTFGISIDYNKKKNINSNIIKKLSLYDLLPKYEDETFENDYSLYVKELNESNRFETKIIKPENKYKFDRGRIEDIKEFIQNVDNLSKRYKIKYRILAKKDINNINNNKVIIYLGFNDELKKYTFKIENSNSFWYEIIKYCYIEKINCYLKNPIISNHIEINPQKELLISRFLYMIRDHKKQENPAQLLDAIKENYTPYIENNTENNCNNLYNSGDLFDSINANSDLLNTNIEEYIAKNKLKIIPLYANINKKKEELKIFFENLNNFHEKHYKTFSFDVILEEKEQFPVTYIQVNYKLFKFIFKNPGISLTEFAKFCENNNIILYEKKN